MVLGGFCSEDHCHIRGPAFAACCAACNASSFVASLGRDAQPVVFFHHTPKTGGSTIECATQGLAGWINLGHAVPGPAVVEACVARHCARAFGPSPRVLRVVSVRNPFTYYESQYYFARAALRRMTRPFVSSLAYGLFRRRQTHLVLDNNFTRFMHAVLTDDTWRREVGLNETLGRICGRPCRPDAVLHTEQLADDFAAARSRWRREAKRRARVVEELVAENDSLAERLEAAVDEVRRLRKAAAADAAAPEGPRRRSGRRRRA